MERHLNASTTSCDSRASPPGRPFDQRAEQWTIDGGTEESAAVGVTSR
jgi:hypothetical protein